MKSLRLILKKKIKGGALQLVIAIALVLFLIIGIFLLRKNLTVSLLSSASVEEQLQLNIRSAVTYLEHKNESELEDSLTMTLFPELNDVTKIQIKPWGMFDVGIISSKIRNRQRKYACFLGRDFGDRNELPSLYFSDPNRYLSVGGFTYLGNNTHLPGFGVRKAYVNGIGYYREQLVFGASHQASGSLPGLNVELETRYNEFIALDADKIQVEWYEGDIIGGTLKRSFFEKPLLIKSTNDLELKDVELVGNIIIHADGILNIDSTAVIDQCLIVAKDIIIGSGFSGRGQFFATENIHAGERSCFFMPTIFTLINPLSGSVILEDFTTFTGNIILKDESRELRPILEIGDRCRLIGQIYCDGFCDFKAVLFGSLYTKGFVAITPNSFNQNYLLNACIDVERMPEEFGGINLIEGNPAFKEIEILF